MDKIVTFDILKPFSEIAHFCTTRQGGVSEGNFSSFNISPFSGDSADNFCSNLQILSHKTGISTNKFVFPFQTHEDKILTIDSHFQHKSLHDKQQALKGIDAIITREKGICIGVTTADCVPILIFDRKQKVIAAVHAGWRGTCARLVEKTIKEMQKTCGTNTKDIFALIGPSISPVVYEVGPELQTLFREADFPVEKIFSEKNEKFLLDLWEANRYLLTENAVPISQIEVSGICTYTEHNNFFSARRLGIKSGRMYSGIALK
ncbi:MAG: peptidoglycan editing factor PgeF [Paludibacteraceae bacterium]|nr:peptidoglycan editing factor PgeF [Paludibacteraceae bacterium]